MYICIVCIIYTYLQLSESVWLGASMHDNELHICIQI